MTNVSIAFLTCLLAVVAQPAIASAESDTGRRLPKVGELYMGDHAGAAVGQKGFRDGLRELGYEDGRNIILVTRYAEGSTQRLERFVTEFVAQNVDVMFINIKAVPLAKRLTSTIPIVSAGFTDPVAEGHAESLSRPGHNITGVSWQTPETSAKRLEFARTLVPGLKRVITLTDPQDPSALVDARALHKAASRLGIAVRDVPVSGTSDFDAAATALRSEPAQALVALDIAALAAKRTELARVAIESHLPFISEGRYWAEAGALLAYGPSPSALFKRAAYYVDKILRGANPADLPIEQPTSFELVINLKTAKALGMKIPESVLLRADEVIR